MILSDAEWVLTALGALPVALPDPTDDAPDISAIYRVYSSKKFFTVIMAATCSEVGTPWYTLPFLMFQTLQ
jgi:hypothetical protein